MSQTADTNGRSLLFRVAGRAARVKMLSGRVVTGEKNATRGGGSSFSVSPRFRGALHAGLRATKYCYFHLWATNLCATKYCYFHQSVGYERAS